ncbi:MAG: hypothetical protein JXA50_00305 [Deltaproteobacteria bacterium]|nr:hypothetical protein [Deltaproteobacteria bacterium]
MSKSVSKIKNMASPPSYYKRVMTRELLKRKKSITLTILIIIFSLIHIGGPLSASANSYATSPRSPNETVCSDSTVVNKYTIAGLKEYVQPSIKLISPRGGEVWEEGKTYEIRWESQGIDAVYISVAVGGKDKGLLEQEGNSKIDAKEGKIAWEIPVGFVTGFGPAKSELVRVEIFDVHDYTICDLSGYFTVEGRKEKAKTSPSLSPYTKLTPKGQDAYTKAIIQYYEAIARRQYREAYDMLGQCKIVLYNADGSGVAYQPRDDYDSWLKTQKNIDTLVIVEVKRYYRGGDPLKYTADKGNVEATLGIRTYMVTLDIKLREQNWAIKSGRNNLLVTVVKGIDDKIRILGIGTGP